MTSLGYRRLVSHCARFALVATVAHVFAMRAHAQSSADPSPTKAPVVIRVDINGADGNVARPTGSQAWAGLLFTDDGVKTTFVVESVEPGSPAAGAKLQVGDTIVSFNDVSMRRVLESPKMFKVGQRITVNYRRNGVQRVALTLARRPLRWPLHDEMRLGFNLADMLSSDVGLPILFGACGSASALPLVGAELISVNPDLASALRLPSAGVLVLVVAPNTPASATGLKAGDVIVGAPDSAVESPDTLVRLIRGATGRSLALTVNRGGKVRNVTLRW